MRRFPVRATIAALSVAFLSSSPGGASRAAELGAVSFPNSGAEEAQGVFLDGLALLHSFEYEEAAEAFRAAQWLDPGFAMAYWGEALTYNHPVWLEQNAEAARAVLARLGATPPERLAKAPTEREQEWLRAVETLFGAGEKHERDRLYEESMAGLLRNHPADPEAAAFAALAILGTAHQGRDFATYMKAAAIVEEAYRSHPRHPGLLHYQIHCYDDPIHAPLGLRAARAYAEVAPGAPHAQHMTSHIFVGLGMWDDVVTANEIATGAVNRKRAPLGHGTRRCGHYNFWLLYGYAQQGRGEKAREILEACRLEAQDSPGTAALDVDRSNLHSFLGMRARYLIDLEAWDDAARSGIARNDTAPEIVIPRESAPERVTFDFTEGLVAARRGDRDTLAAARARLSVDRRDLAAHVESQPDDDGPATLERAAILELELEGLAARLAGNPATAIAKLEEAVRKEEALPLMFGPPFIDKPSHELLGELLLEQGRGRDAMAAYEKALARTPGRVAALSGLARACEQAGDSKRAAELKERLLALRPPRRDPPLAPATR